MAGDSSVRNAASEPVSANRIVDVLRKHSGLTAPQIAHSIGVTRSAVNKVLYGNPRVFLRSDDQRPRWSIDGLTPNGRQTTSGQSRFTARAPSTAHHRPHHGRSGESFFACNRCEWLMPFSKPAFICYACCAGGGHEDFVGVFVGKPSLEWRCRRCDRLAAGVWPAVGRDYREALADLCSCPVCEQGVVRRIRLRGTG